MFNRDMQTSVDPVIEVLHPNSVDTAYGLR